MDGHFMGIPLYADIGQVIGPNIFKGWKPSKKNIIMFWRKNETMMSPETWYDTFKDKFVPQKPGTTSHQQAKVCFYRWYRDIKGLSDDANPLYDMELRALEASA